MQLTSLQLRILVKLALPGRMTLERLLAAAMPRKLDINQRPLMENEIRLQIDLLAMFDTDNAELWNTHFLRSLRLAFSINL